MSGLKRSDLDELPTNTLHRLIADASAVLEARGEKPTTDVDRDAAPDASLLKFEPPARAADAVYTATSSASPVTTGSLFTFGVDSSSPALGSSGLFTGKAGGLFSGTGGSLFSGSTGGGLFGAPASSGSPGNLFGGSGGGLFGGSGGSFAPSGGLFAGIGGTAPVASSGEKGGDEDGEDGELVKEEEITEVAGWTPSVSLQVKDSVETGEENEEQVYSQRSKLYRWRDGEWKERGLGEARLLRNSQGQVRFLLRQEKTGKVAANHLPMPYCELRPNADSEKIWVWNALDCSEDPPEVQQFGLKFGTLELASAFKEAFEAAKESNSKAAASDEKK